MGLPSFVEAVFPVDISYGSSGGPKFSTVVTTTDSGAERRQANWSAPLRAYNVSTGIQSLEAADQVVAFSKLLQFFNAMYGKAIGFRWKDWSDYTTADDLISSPSAFDQVLGTGDGTRTAFQLVRAYATLGGEYAVQRILRKPVYQTTLVSVNGVAMDSGWDVDITTGIVTFAVPPTVGTIVRAGCEYHVPVRFDEDSLSVRLEDYILGSAQIPVQEIRV